MRKKYIDIGLPTPEHDELIIKLLNKELWERLISKYSLCSISESDAEFFKKEGIKFKVTGVQTEVPIVVQARRYEYIAGYADIEVYCGYIQRLSPDYDHSHLSFTIGCEVKTAAEPSLGSVIRQVKRYQQLIFSKTFNSQKWVVVSPFKEWQEPLRSQGLTWISSELVLALSQTYDNPN